MISENLFKRYNLSKEEFNKLTPAERLEFRFRYEDIKETYLHNPSFFLPFLNVNLLLMILSVIGIYAFYYSEVLVTFCASLFSLSINFLFPLTIVLFFFQIFVDIRNYKTYKTKINELIKDYFQVNPTTVKKKMVKNGK